MTTNKNKIEIKEFIKEFSATAYCCNKIKPKRRVKIRITAKKKLLNKHEYHLAIFPSFITAASVIVEGKLKRHYY